MSLSTLLAPYRGALPRMRTNDALRKRLAMQRRAEMDVLFAAIRREARDDAQRRLEQARAS